MDWYLEVLEKYAVFEGRARRREYWYFVLFNFLISFAIASLDVMLDTAVLYILYGFAVMIPSLAVAVRRLHDTGRSGWWLLISMIPLLGGIVLLVFTVEDSESGTNLYGPNPKHADLAAANDVFALT